MKTQREVISSLETSLKALRAMEPLEPSAKDLTPEEESAWLAQHARIQNIVSNAEREVEALLPAEVRRALQRVREESYTLYATRDEEEPFVQGKDRGYVRAEEASDQARLYSEYSQEQGRS